MDVMELMDVKATAEYLRLSKSYIYQLVKNKKLKHIRISNKIMFTKKMLNEFLLLHIVEGDTNEK